MNHCIKEIISRGLNKTRIVDFALRQNSNQLLILMYHKFIAKPAKPIKNGLRFHTVVAKDFEDQVAYLSKNFNVIGFEELSSALPKNAAIITFDDGYYSNYQIAFPILKKYNVKATIFLTVNQINNQKCYWWDRLFDLLYYSLDTQISVPKIGTIYLRTYDETLCSYNRLKNIIKLISDKKKKYLLNYLEKNLNISPIIFPEKNKLLTWSQIKEMKGQGIEFGCHTMSHPILTRISKDHCEQEISNSVKVLKDRGLNPIAFAYPNGTPEDYNSGIINLLKNNGIKYAVTTCYGLNTPKIKKYELRRIGVSYDDSMAVFKTKVSGIYDCFANVRVAYEE